MTSLMECGCSGCSVRSAKLRWGMVALVLALLVGCGTAPKAPAGAAPGQRATQWVEPYAFQLRRTSATANLLALRERGARFVVRSAGAPEVAKVVAEELRAAGLPMAREGEADAAGKPVVLELTARVAALPPDDQYDPKKGIDLLPATEEALRTGGAILVGEGAGSGLGLQRLVIPLGGYRTSFGKTGVSQAEVTFVLANLLGATGARERFNSMFGADATGTVCFRLQGRNSLICDRRKGPTSDVSLALAFTDQGTNHKIETVHSLIQLAVNPMQGLSFAVSDLRDAALGLKTPLCQYMNSKVREPDCDVPPMNPQPPGARP